MGSFFDIMGRVILGIVRSEHFTRIAHYAVRQATAAVIKDVQRRTAISRRGGMHIS